ncbi:hypothetical protein B0T19DRAFT_444792 [Cercophora scortea]|uniref:Uncharacterized protein n=1 Tax=Cercophora scortea TaxID=314031 RepID=A0AAE0I9E1_9PEZI|nr:hypothetical protein B0T19DRAFT_444792 [Cercophora scortea]
MKFLSFLILSAAGSAIALPKGGGGGHRGNGTQSATAVSGSGCKQLNKLTQLTNLAANQTRLDEVTKGNATKAEAIKAKASAAATQLATLQANATLVASCEQKVAVRAAENQCEEMFKLEKLQALVANQTALDEKTKNNATKADAIKAKAAAGATVLAELQGNATLAQICAVEQTKSLCRDMSKLQKEIALAANTTALDAKFEGNATKIAKFQAKVADAQAKLTALQSNTTLTDTCASIKSTTGSGSASTVAQQAASTASASAATASGITSGVASLQSLGTVMSVASAMLFGALLL